MEINNGLATLLVISMLIVGGLVGGLIAGGRDVIEVEKVVIQEKLVQVECPVVAASELICPEFVMPEFQVEEKLAELWEAEYSGDLSYLENVSEDKAKLQFLEDNEGFDKNWSYFFEDDEVFDLVTEGVECDGDCVVEYIKEYDDREVEVINLGLDDEDDRLVELSTMIRVKVFTDEDDDEEYFFDKVYINSVVTSDDGVLEAEVTYSI